MSPSVRRESPLYVQLAAEFRRLITRNAWQVGARLPTVESLATQYSVARITVRQAMTLLAQEGLVTRSRGRGTHVAKAPELTRWHRLSAPWDEFMRSAPGGTSRIIEDRATATLPEVAPHEGRLDGAYRFLRVIGSRGEGPPLVVRDVYIHAPVYKAIKERIARASMVDLLGEHAERVTILNEIAAAVPRVARLLNLPVGTPVLEGRHVGTDKTGRVVFLDFPVLRGDYVKFEIVVARGGRQH